MSLEEREIQHNCEVHGESTAKQIRMNPEEPWWPVKCEQCLDDKKTAEEKRSQSQTESNQAEIRRHKIKKAMAGAAIPERFAGRVFDTYNAIDEGTNRALAQCLHYAQNFEYCKKLGKSLIMTGTTGTGKTHLACAIAHHIIQEFAMTAVYCTAGRALRMVKDTYRRDSQQTEIEALRFFAQPDLLIIDEIGVQYGTDAEKNILFDIINERYEKMLPTILISNLAVDKLKDYVGDRIIDRMRENGGQLIVFDWKSHRMQRIEQA